MSKYFYHSKNNTRHFRMLFLFTESPPWKAAYGFKVHERVVDFYNVLVWRVDGSGKVKQYQRGSWKWKGLLRWKALRIWMTVSETKLLNVPPNALQNCITHRNSLRFCSSVETKLFLWRQVILGVVPDLSKQKKGFNFYFDWVYHALKGWLARN